MEKEQGAAGEVLEHRTLLGLMLGSPQTEKLQLV